MCVQHVDFSSIQLITGEASTFSRYYVTTDEFGIFCTAENEFFYVILSSSTKIAISMQIHIFTNAINEMELK